MYLQFEKHPFKGFVLAASLPPNFKGRILHGGQIKSAAGEPGIIVLQELFQPEFSIYYQLFDLVKPSRFPARQDNAFLVAILAIKDSLHYFIKGLGSFHLRQGQFALLHTVEHDNIMRFDKGGRFQCLEIIWPQALVHQALPHFPILQPLFSGKDLKKSFYLHPPGKAAGAHALGLVDAMLNSPHDDKVAWLSFRFKVHEYMLSLLKEAEKKPIHRITLTQDKYERIYLIADKLRSYPARKFPIVILAREVGLSATKLKMVFKDIFGQGILEYQLAAKMREAHRLLEETELTTKAIAAKVGYDLTSSFVTKFREYFGYPPSEVGKRQ